MGKAVKLIVVLIILIALGVAAKVAVDKLPTSDDSGGGSFITADALKRLYGGDPSELPAGVKVLEPTDCQADDDAWVKKSECAVDGLALTGDITSCGAGKEIWIRDPDHSSFVAAVGTGTCEEEERDCTVECPVDCEGDTYIDPDPPCTAPTGVVLDGVNTCGVGLRTYELDTNADDYVAPIGKGTCNTSFKNVCEVECPEGVRPETSCVDYANPQKSANGCLVSKLPRARLVTYDEPGFQEWFRLPEDPTAPGCDDEGHMDSWWVPCTGPPRPVNCEGTWGADGGWGECVSEKPCEAQTEKKRTFTRTKEAAHGGTCNLPTDGHIETSVVGCPLKGPCCTVDKSSPVASGEDYKQALEGGGYTCVQPVTYPSDEAYPDACLDKAEEALNAGRNAEQFAKTGVTGCCWHENDWTPVVGSAESITDMSVPTSQGGHRNCLSTGLMTQKQTVYGQNCAPGVEFKYNVPCEYIGEWEQTDVPPIGHDCPTDGYNKYKRKTMNSAVSTTKTEPCTYIGEWEKDGECGEYGRAIQRWKRHVQHSSEASSGDWPCCDPGDWTPYSCKARDDSPTSHKGDLKQSRSIDGCNPGEAEYDRTIENGCEFRGCKITLREHWCRDGGAQWGFNYSDEKLNDHGANNTVSSILLSGDNCTADFYENNYYNKWYHSKSVKNVSHRRPKCFDLPGPDNELSSFKLTNYDKDL